MAEERDLVLRFSAEGAQQVLTQFKAIEDASAKLSETFRKAFGVEQLAQQQQKTTGLLQAIGRGVQAFQSALSQGAVAASGFGGAIGLVSIALRGLTSPIGMVTIATAGFSFSMKKLADAARDSATELRQLQSVTGLTLSATEDLANTFQLAGVRSDTLQLALFRLGIEIETGGGALERLGVSLRRSTGELKSEGEILLELRDRISQMGSTSQRNAVLLELFGRSGRMLGRSFSMTAEQWERLESVARRYTTATEEFDEKTRAYSLAVTELSQAWEQLKMQIATAIGLPTATWLAETATAAVKVTREYLLPALRTGADLLFPGLTSLLGVPTAEKETAQVLDRIRRTMAQTQDAIMKGTTEQNAFLSRVQAQEAQLRIRIETEQQERTLMLAQQYAAERAKIETGSDQTAIQNKIAVNNQLIRLAQERYDRELDIQRRTLTGGPLVLAELQLRRDRDAKIQQLEAESQRLELQRDMARLADRRRIFEMEVLERQAMNARVLAGIEDRYQRERVLVDLLTNDQQRARETVRLVEREALEVGRAKIAQIDQEINRWRQLAAEFPQVYELQREAQKRLLELSQQRFQAEREMQNRSIEAQKQAAQAAIQAAGRVADVARSGLDLALGRLEQLGQEFVTLSELTSSWEDSLEQARDTFETLAAGGAVSAQQLRQAQAVAGVMRQAADVGAPVMPGAAFSEMAGALYGQPSATQREAEAQRRQMRWQMQLEEADRVLGAPEWRGTASATGLPLGGAAPGALPVPSFEVIPNAYQQAMEASEGAVSRGMDRILAKIEAGNSRIARALFDRFSDELIRKIEFEASRA